jgi:8-oxo-dGTP pyrophosphatase MutT (NUDIX family)
MNNFEQSGVIPYRFKDGSLQILLITSIKRKRWIVPKGYVEFNLSEFESAKKEAFEEAGVSGSNETIDIGVFKYRKNGSLTNIHLFSMEVIDEHNNYPEKNLRERRWFPLDEAVKVVDADLALLIERLAEKINFK